MNNYPEIVNTIHKEFNTASEKILAEAKEIITTGSEKLIEKTKRLSALGFHNTDEATKGRNLIQKLAMTKEAAELVQYYSFHYPLNKFITEEQVKAICEKYGLVCGKISQFKGFVPEMKLVQIENFKLRKEEIPYAIMVDRDFQIIRYMKEEELILEPWERKQIEHGLDYFVGGDDVHSVDRDTIKRIPKNLFPFVTSYSKISRDIKNLMSFQICAPSRDMKTEGMTLVDGYKLIHNPDPVVLQPVNGGYLIVAAWGDEASDENVVNQVNN